MDYKLTESLSQTPVVATLLFVTIYSAYYFISVVKRPIIACSDAGFRRFLDRHVPISKEKFWPTWWCFESRFQTICRAFLQSFIDIKYESEFIKTPDGGEIQLDWLYNNENCKYEESTRPTIILLPGLTGNSQENYILNMVKDASDLGYRCVVFINRGLGSTQLKTPRTYCAANVEDVELVMDYVKEKYPSAPLMATGVSLGGMILLNYLAKTGDKAKVEAAMVVSVAWNVFSAVESLTTSINCFLFNRTLARALCYMVKRNMHLFKDHFGINLNNVLKCKTIQEFDEHFTAKVFGYSSLNHYYTEASPDFKIPYITKPVLCLSSADDPFQPGHAIPLNKARESDHVAIVMTSHGGHIGFLEGTLPRNHNYMNRWFKQYVSAVFTHGIKDL